MPVQACEQVPCHSCAGSALEAADERLECHKRCNKAGEDNRADQHYRQHALQTQLIARPSSCWHVHAKRVAAVTRCWRACGREGRGYGLTAANSVRPGCAVCCRSTEPRRRSWQRACRSEAGPETRMGGALAPPRLTFESCVCTRVCTLSLGSSRWHPPDRSALGCGMFLVCVSV